MNDRSSILVSIIVPCYNGSATLPQAIASVLAKPPAFTHEVIIVDDASTDNSPAVIAELAAAHPAIRVITHPENRGGGAARNTGIKAAAGKYIYCLDADNFFAPDSLNRLVAFAEERGAAGVLFEEQRFFFGTDDQHIEQKWNTAFIGRPIDLEVQFSHPELIIDNFLHTKESYGAAGGYPEHHGFDTQSYQTRWLAAGGTLAVCPSAAFYHRMAQKTSTYFEREYNRGNLSLNYYLIMEDIWDRLSDRAKDEILHFDIFARADMNDNLTALIFELGQAKQLLGRSSGTYAALDRFMAEFRAGRYQPAQIALGEFITGYGLTKVLAYDLLRTAAGLAGIPARQISQHALDLADGLKRKQRRLFRSYHRFYWANRLAGWLAKLKRLFK
jgi:glycosyltransferase involved in cell wall biosynthesis